jgi:hypothetical protein
MCQVSFVCSKAYLERHNTLWIVVLLKIFFRLSSTILSLRNKLWTINFAIFFLYQFYDLHIKNGELNEYIFLF